MLKVSRIGLGMTIVNILFVFAAWGGTTAVAAGLVEEPAVEQAAESAVPELSVADIASESDVLSPASFSNKASISFSTTALVPDEGHPWWLVQPMPDVDVENKLSFAMVGQASEQSTIFWDMKFDSVIDAPDLEFSLEISELYARHYFTDELSVMLGRQTYCNSTSTYWLPLALVSAGTGDIGPSADEFLARPTPIQPRDGLGLEYNAGEWAADVSLLIGEAPNLPDVVLRSYTNISATDINLAATYRYADKSIDGGLAMSRYINEDLEVHGEAAWLSMGSDESEKVRWTLGGRWEASDDTMLNAEYARGSDSQGDKSSTVLMSVIFSELIKDVKNSLSCILSVETGRVTCGAQISWRIDDETTLSIDGQYTVREADSGSPSDVYKGHAALVIRRYF